MVTIIEPSIMKTTSCENCGCKFSYEKEDIGMKELANPLDKNIILFLPMLKCTQLEYVECPKCHKLVWLKSVK